MIIDCPACERTYHVAPADVEGGRTVICPRCDARWHVGSRDLDVRVRGFGELPRLAAPDRLLGESPPSFDARPPAPKRRRVSRGVTLGLASLALVSLTIGARAKIVQMMPRTAALYGAAGLPVNLRGLAFRHVHSLRSEPTSSDVVVSGEIRNVTHARTRVPRLVFEIRDAEGNPLARWSETAPAKLLAAGRTLAFASTPHAVPPESRAVLVQFEADDTAS